MKRIQGWKSMAMLFVVPLTFAVSVKAAWALPFQSGDVFANVGGGLIKEFTPSGTFYQTLNTTHPGEGDGMAFDSAGNLYATAGFAANTVVKFDNNGALTNANFGSGYNSHPESIVIDNTNNVLYIGQADGTANVLKFNTNGTPGTPANFAPARQNRGTDWVDLESDLHTLRYTSEGNTIFRYDLNTQTQLTPFATGLPAGTAFAHRILADGGELLANSSNILRLNSSGAVSKTYTLAGTSLLFALNLDPDGTTFWTADYFSGNIFRVDIATGNIVTTWNAFSVGSPTNPGGPLGGLAVFGELCQTCPTPGPVVPEPSTFILLGTGLVGLAIFIRQRSNNVAQLRSP